MKKLFILSIPLFYLTAVHAQQVSDTSFHHPIAHPAYKQGQGPLVLYDEAHNNPFPLRAQYAAFNELLRNDGYLLKSSKQSLVVPQLDRVKIYVTVNAIYDPLNWDLPARPAFSEQEADILVDWVKAGGSLLLVTDHMPCGAAVSTIAQRLGFNVLNGLAIRKDGTQDVFSKSAATLEDNVITTQVDSIMCWGCTGFIPPPTATVISRLGDNYNVYLPSRMDDLTYPPAETIPFISGIGLANGAFMKFGKGRVVIFADGGAFTAQLEGIKSYKRGMNHPDAGQNAQFLLNIIHWLDKQ